MFSNNLPTVVSKEMFCCVAGGYLRINWDEFEILIQVITKQLLTVFHS